MRTKCHDLVKFLIVLKTMKDCWNKEAKEDGKIEDGKIEPKVEAEEELEVGEVDLLETGREVTEMKVVVDFVAVEEAGATEEAEKEKRVVSGVTVTVPKLTERHGTSMDVMSTLLEKTTAFYR